MKCPKCGHTQADGYEECAKCGVIFAKIVNAKPQDGSSDQTAKKAVLPTSQSESHNKRSRFKGCLPQALLAFSILIAAYLLLGLLVTILFSFDNSRKQRLSECTSKVEITAMNIAACIADYYSIPTNVDIPTIEILKKDCHLSFYDEHFSHTYSIEGIPYRRGNGFYFKITILLDDRCSKINKLGTKYVKFLDYDADWVEQPQSDVEGWN